MQTHNSNDETPGKNDKDTTKKNNSDVNIEQNQTQQKKSRKLTQITNWNLKIISKLSELKNIEKGLLSNTLVKACQGRYVHSNNTSNPSLHIIIKFQLAPRCERVNTHGRVFPLREVLTEKLRRAMQL